MNLTEAVMEASRRMGRRLSSNEKTLVFMAWLQTDDGQDYVTELRVRGTDPHLAAGELLKNIDAEYRKGAN